MINSDTVWVVMLHQYTDDEDDIYEMRIRDDQIIVGIFLTENEAKDVKKKLDKIYADDDIHETVLIEWPIGRIVDDFVLQDISDFEKYGVI